MQTDELAQAVAALTADDAFRVHMTPAQWRSLAPYLTRHEIRAGDLLVRQGDTDRTMYLLEQGSLQVFVTGGPPGSNRIAVLRPGSVVGEPSLFCDMPRMANVEAMTPCVAWGLHGSRIVQMTLDAPSLACELLRAAGGVMAARMRANLLKHTPMS